MDAASRSYRYTHRSDRASVHLRKALGFHPYLKNGCKYVLHQVVNFLYNEQTKHMHQNILQHSFPEIEHRMSSYVYLLRHRFYKSKLYYLHNLPQSPYESTDHQ